MSKRTEVFKLSDYPHIEARSYYSNRSLLASLTSTRSLPLTLPQFKLDDQNLYSTCSLVLVPDFHPFTLFATDHPRISKESSSCFTPTVLLTISSHSTSLQSTLHRRHFGPNSMMSGRNSPSSSNRSLKEIVNRGGHHESPS